MSDDVDARLAAIERRAAELDRKLDELIELTASLRDGIPHDIARPVSRPRMGRGDGLLRGCLSRHGRRFRR
ncbi:hypothetical protein [Amycolatopsis antarctica]|nr:hypothetical protein [Amycolatopsis antarctica]